MALKDLVVSRRGKLFVRGWAVTKAGKIVVHNDNPLKPLLLFNKKYLADGAVWKPGEKVSRVSIIVG